MASLDLHAPGSHPIRLGDSPHGLTLIRYNHKPTLSEDLATATVRRDGKKRDYKLSITDDEDEYVYKAQAGDDQDMMVLLLDDSGDGLVLEMADASLACNLVEAPWESDAKKLAHQYPTLRAEESIEQPGSNDNSSHSTPDDSEADPSNPFDFRNYVGVFTPAPSAPTRTAAPTKANAPTSVTSTPRSTPAAARKAANPLVSSQRKTKPRASAGTSAPAVPPSKRRKTPPPAAAAPSAVPSVRVSTSGRAAEADIQFDFEDAEADDADDDTGDLILDDGPPKHASHKRAANASSAAASAHLRAAVEGGGGPISLRSAASSPGSRVASPAAGAGRRPAHYADNEDDSDGGLQLEVEEPDPAPVPAPPPPRRRSSAAVQADDAEGDDDDELEAEMLRAMQEEDDDDEAPRVSRYVEEEEESEEE